MNFGKIIPKNFIVASIVDTLKSDPEAGAQKVFDLADKFVADEEVAHFVEEAKSAYCRQPNIRAYIKNLVYNTQKSSLNHFLNNLVVKHLLDGIPKRLEKQEKLKIQIPHLYILNVGYGENTMPEEAISRLVTQGKELGIHFIIVAGDALAHPGFWGTCEKNPDVQFLAFAKAADLDASLCQRLKSYPNLNPLVQGTQDVSQLKAASILFGRATEVNPANFLEATSDAAILPDIRQGSRIGFYITSKADRLAPEQLQRIRQRINAIRQVRPYACFHLESENADFGGSLYFNERVNQKEIQLLIPSIGPEVGNASLKDLF
ncbi:MAG: hypothetical protein FWF59_01025 [Turicibacter sp.]|nr:hypothetical protein [Turicibacter sp.]